MDQPKKQNLPVAQNNLVRQAISILSKKYGKKYRTREIRSIWELASTSKAFTYFNGEESANVKGYANYGTSALIKTPTGMLVSIRAELTGASFTPLDYSAGSTAFDVYKEAARLINTLGLEYEKDNVKKRDFFLSQLHQPLFEIVKFPATGTPADTYRGVALINTKETIQPVSILSEIGKTSTVNIKAALPSAAAALDSDLDNHLLTVYALIAEEDV